ncbi:MAG: hypothetical protein AB7O24_16275 [Kofleriaceae bacterium]
MRWGIAIIIVCALASAARADDFARNWLLGPVLGYRLWGPPGDRLIIGLEGGVGIGPERVNVGMTHRLDHEFYYIELDPWLYVGASLGIGIDSNGVEHGVIGIWEGTPLNDVPCTDGFHRITTLAIGYRYTGVHELYLTVKAGQSETLICSH